MKKIAWTLALTLGLISCSSVKEHFKKKREVKKSRRTVRNYGPAQKESPVFKDATKELGLDGQSAIHLYAVDFDGDGDTDLVSLPSYYSAPRFFKRTKEARFTQVESPLPEGVQASYLIFADFNRDGLYDLIVGVLNQKTELTPRALRIFVGRAPDKENPNFRYEEFVNPVDRMKFNPTSSLAILDYDLDGELDVFEANWFDLKESPPGLVTNRIFKGQADKNKQAQEVTYLLEDELKFNEDEKRFVNARPTFGVGICDLDDNGYPDIMTSNSDGHLNKLWMNLYDRKNKDRIFKDYGESSGFAQDDLGKLNLRGGGNSFFAVCNDYNNDGIYDVLTGELTRSIDNETRDRSSVLTGASPSFPPKFIRSEYYMSDGTLNWNQGDRRAIWADFNNDGLSDVLVENSGFPPHSRLILFEQTKDHELVDKGKDYGIDLVNPSGIISLDINGDGKMDFISGQSSLRAYGMKPRLYAFINKTETKNKGLRFYLRGKKANTFGIGATVELVSNKRIQKRFVEYSNGNLPSQNEEGIHFGLEEDEKAIELRVRWPYLKKGKPQRWGYDLENSNKSYQQFTVCDNGKLSKGRLKYCR